jgi:hypothetical protein
MFVNGLGQNEQSLERTFHRCFLPSFTSFGRGVSEKIKMWKVNGRRTPSDGKSSHCLWQGELKKDAAASNKVYQLLACGRWSSPASSTTKTGRHDIADILLKVELKHQKSNQIKSRQVYRGNRRKITEGFSQVGYSFYSYHKYICRVALGGMDPIK